MVRRAILTVALLTGCVWCLTLVAHTDRSPPASTDAASSPTASLPSLMQGQARHIEAMSALLARPDTPDRANAVAVEAELLAELAGASGRHRDAVGFRERARALRGAALDLAAEVRGLKCPDEGRITLLFERLTGTCGACHVEFRGEGSREPRVR